MTGAASTSSSFLRTKGMAQALWDLKSIQSALTSGLEVALSEVGFTADQFQVLFSISKLGSPTMGEILGDVNMANASLSRIVDSLEDRALAFRLPNPSDRRRITVNLSDMGVAKLDQVLSSLSAWASASDGVIDVEMAEKLRALAQKIGKSDL
jgi:DNA-binding MarR family transcriptional regulator